MKILLALLILSAPLNSQGVIISPSPGGVYWQTETPQSNDPSSPWGWGLPYAPSLGYVGFP